MTNDERLKLAHNILSSDLALESDLVLLDLAQGKEVTEREKNLAHLVSALYKVIHPAFGCQHGDWDKVSESNLVVTCLSVDCPERRSTCCNAISEAVSGDEGTGYFACSVCKKEYVGGECNAQTLN